MAITSEVDARRAAEWAKANPNHPRRAEVLAQLRAWDEARRAAPPDLMGQQPGDTPAPQETPQGTPPPSLEPNPNAGPPPRGETVYQDAFRRIAGPVTRGIAGLVGVGEMALSAGTSIAGQAVGGLHGILHAPQGADRAADSVENVSRLFTYSPKTQAGQEIARGIAEPLEKYDMVIRDVSNYIGGGDPALAATAYTIFNAPMVGRGSVGMPGRFQRNMMARNAAAAAERVWLEQGIQLGSRKMADQIARAAQAQNTNVPNYRGGAIESLPDDVRLASKIASDEIDSAFARARAGNTYVSLKNVDELVNNVNSILEQYNAPNSSFNILDTDKQLRDHYNRIMRWAAMQRRARTPGDVAGENIPPVRPEAPGTGIVPAGPLTGSAIPINMPDFDVQRQPGPNVRQPRIGSNLPVPPMLEAPARTTLPAAQGGRELVPSGPLRTEQTVTGRTPPGGREIPGTNAIIHLNELDHVRRTLKSMLPERRKNWTPQDRLRFQMKDALDDFINRQFDQGMISGTDADLAAWNRARGLVTEYRRNFEVNKRIYDLATNLDANPEDFRKYIFGLAQVGAKTESAQVIAKLKDIFGENSPQLNAIRAEFLMNALEPLRGPTPNLQKFVDYVENINKNNRSLVEELSPFAATGLDELARVARAAINAGDPASVQFSIPKLLARFTIGHQIARKGALVATSAAILEAMFGKSPRAVRREMLNELIGIQMNEPLFKPNTMELQGLWAAALNEAWTREFEEQQEGEE